MAYSPIHVAGHWFGIETSGSSHYKHANVCADIIPRIKAMPASQIGMTHAALRRVYGNLLGNGIPRRCMWDIAQASDHDRAIACSFGADDNIFVTAETTKSVSQAMETMALNFVAD